MQLCLMIIMKKIPFIVFIEYQFMIMESVIEFIEIELIEIELINELTT